MKLGRMVYNDKNSIPFEDEINRIDRIYTAPKRHISKYLKKLWVEFFQILHKFAL